MKKNIKIILAVVLTAVILGGIGVGIYFALKSEDPVETVFSETGNVKIIDADTIEFSYLCPYMGKNTEFDIINKDGFILTYVKNEKDSEISGTIISQKYERYESESFKTGTLTLEIQLEDNLSDGISYHAVLKENSIELKKQDYVNPDISADFNVTANSDNSLSADEIKYANASLSVPSNVKARFEKEGTKTYFVFEADIEGVTKYDESAVKNMSAMIMYRHIEEGNRVIYAAVNEDKNAVIEVNDGKVYAKSEVTKDILFPGDDYECILLKGFFVNDDKSVVNDLYKGTFTYVEK